MARIWDINKNSKSLIESFSPIFNRCVIFETNEISYHGHPKPLKTPKGISRKAATSIKNGSINTTVNASLASISCRRTFNLLTKCHIPPGRYL